MKNECSCDELLEMINDLIDGELEGEKLNYVQSLIEANPQCRAMFHTVSKTISLYKMRRQEIENSIHPSINWENLESKIRHS
ncbi:hypothetical protein JW823_04995 [bacterium]|nr:hypothetical protein [candidate division CSSED10-310 bacterium]